MNTAISNELKTASDKLIELLSSFEQTQINRVPFEGSWTAAQVADHLLKSDSGVLSAIHGKVEPTKRQPDEKVAEIKAIFLDFTTKMKSPLEIIPTNEPQQKEVMISNLSTKMTALQEASKTLDLSETCVDTEFPESGYITRLEWLHFFLYHTQRHTHQLENIFKKIAKI